MLPSEWPGKQIQEDVRFVPYVLSQSRSMEALILSLAGWAKTEFAGPQYAH